MRRKRHTSVLARFVRLISLLVKQPTLLVLTCFPFFHAPRFLGRRSVRNGGFTLVEIMTVICILLLLIFLGSSAFENLGSTSRMTAAQMLVGAVEEARSEAMRTGKVSMLAFRQKPDEFGQAAWREFGVVKHETLSTGDGCHLEWRQIPKGISLWPGTPTGVAAGTNLLTLPPKLERDYSIPNLAAVATDTDQLIAILFGELGEVIYPSAQAALAVGGATIPAVPGPYYLAVAEENQTAPGMTPKNFQLIEIRPVSGRAQLLP